MIIKMQYIAVKQRSNEFYLTKVSAYDLKKVVDFHFREPYKEYTNYRNQSFDKLMKDFDENDVKVVREITTKDGDGSVQRTLNKGRVYEIKKFVTEDETAFFPNSVLLSIDMSKYEKEFEMHSDGTFELDSELMNVSVIDGQHRLAGIFLCDDHVLKEMEIPVIFLINISIATASILFQQINGKQRQVNKSVLFDLFDNVDSNLIDNEDDKETKNYHLICQSLFFDIESPLYRQIKMLGTGTGAISQAFFIETCKKELKVINNLDVSDRYNRIFDYLKKFQEIFPEDWPVPLDPHKCSEDKLDEHSYKILTIRKSQLAKTNGFGAIIKLLSYLIKNELSLDSLWKLSGEIDWVNISGTGKKSQEILYQKMVKVINSSEAIK